MTPDSILIVEPFLPFPSKSGGHVAIYNGLKAIHDRFKKVFLIFPAKPGKALQEETGILKSAFPNLAILPYIDDRYRGTAVERCKKEVEHFFERMTTRRPVIAKDLYGVKDFSNGFQQFIRDTIAGNSISLVQIEFHWLLPLVACLPENVTKIFVHHEIGFVRQQLNLDLWGRNVYREAAVKLGQWFETALLNRYDAVITLSDTDRRKLIQAGVTVPVYASMAVVDCKPYRETTTEGTETVTFLGPYSHDPNRDGVMWFLENCWDKLLEKNPDFRLRIIGNWRKSRIRKIKKRYAQVDFAGMVDDLGAALTGTTMIVPIRIGSGIRMKILEAARLGVPFVTTRVGVEGLPFANGEDCFITDNPDTFVDDIIRLENQALRKKFTAEARKKVDAMFSFQAFKQNRTQIIDRITSCGNP